MTLTGLFERPRWQERAACRGRTDLLNLFVPVARQEKGNKARKCSEKIPEVVADLCRHCPVKRECLADVTAYDAMVKQDTNRLHSHGSKDVSIRAGLTPTMRAKLA